MAHVLDVFVSVLLLPSVSSPAIPPQKMSGELVYSSRDTNLCFRQREHQVLVSAITRHTLCVCAVDGQRTTSRKKDVHPVATRALEPGNVTTIS